MTKRFSLHDFARSENAKTVNQFIISSAQISADDDVVKPFIKQMTLRPTLSKQTRHKNLQFPPPPV